MANPESVFIIAEAGVNHNGSLGRAKEMVKAAAQAGADAVKFQTFKAEQLVTRSAVKAEYQKKRSDAGETQLDMLKNLELSYDDHMELAEVCCQNKIEFLSAPFDMDAVDLLIKIGVRRWKIPSGEITNLPYLRKIAATRKKIILSTGMAYLEEIESALSVFINQGYPLDAVTVLHCNTEYPTPMADVNLTAMKTILKSFPGIQVGYSDHTLGIEVPVAAAALGAKVIEKHFTMDKDLEGPDHAASLTPSELKDMVRAVRNIEIALGSPVKTPSPSEKKNKVIARKSIVAACAIKIGDVYTENNLTAKRPGNGISPMRWDEFLGRKANRNYKPDEQIDA